MGHPTAEKSEQKRGKNELLRNSVLFSFQTSSEKRDKAMATVVIASGLDGIKKKVTLP